MLNKDLLRKMKINLRKLRFELEKDPVNLSSEIHDAAQKKTLKLISIPELTITHLMFRNIL